MKRVPFSLIAIEFLALVIMGYYLYLEHFCETRVKEVIVLFIPTFLAVMAIFIAANSNRDSSKEMKKNNQSLEELICIAKGIQTNTTTSKKKKKYRK